MAKVDKLAMTKYNIKVEQMMENAGRNLARFISNNLKPKKIIVFFGKGNNGGGGLVGARHLAIYGFNVQIISASKKVNENVRHQLKILRSMGIKPQKSFKAKKGDVIIDALLGYNIKGSPRLRYRNLINAINFMKKQGLKVVSLDIPSGIDPNKGIIHEAYVKADYTLTLALPKKGLKELKNVYLVNIGIPNKVYSHLNIEIKNYFEKSDVVKISQYSRKV